MTDNVGTADRAIIVCCASIVAATGQKVKAAVLWVTLNYAMGETVFLFRMEWLRCAPLPLSDLSQKDFRLR